MGVYGFLLPLSALVRIKIQASKYLAIPFTSSGDVTITGGFGPGPNGALTNLLSPGLDHGAARCDVSGLTPSSVVTLFRIEAAPRGVVQVGFSSARH